ncbi:MAG: DNA polymerase IV [Nitrospiraceae bacterium]|nr:DNA polymerase IV [Nitrospiraceae bacterium]|tara:strand:- start:1512 stop:2738 length:1227 start_codon:yes stop_codon:yes gene_type:complete
MMSSRWIIHIDMDAFYAAIEQHDHPQYRGKPVIVGADPQKGKGRGVVSAASYEARTCGIHSAMPIRHAFQRCPQGIFLPVRMPRYRESSDHIFSILQRYTNLVESLSLDEAFLDVTGSVRLHGSAQKIGRQIQQEIQNAEGLTASVGIASNKFVAKVASDLKKPHGFVIVPSGTEADFLKNLPIERLWGAGPKTAIQLRRLGCSTIGDVAKYSPHMLMKIFGTHGRHLQEHAQGIDGHAVIPEEPAKSMGAETTFDEDTRDIMIIHATLLQLAEQVARRLRRAGVRSQTVTLKFRDESFQTITRTSSAAAATNQSSDLYQRSLSLLKRIPHSKKKVRLLGITASKLSPAKKPGDQLSLFAPHPEKAQQLTTVLDTIQEKFGTNAISRASVLTTKTNRITGHRQKNRKR